MLESDMTLDKGHRLLVALALDLYPSIGSLVGNPHHIGRILGDSLNIWTIENLGSSHRDNCQEQQTDD
jgi:hypothetical protein